MQGAACMAGGRVLLSPPVCLKGSWSSVRRPVQRPNYAMHSIKAGVQCSRRRRMAISASVDWSSSRGRLHRGVVSEDVEGIPVGEYGERYLVPSSMEEIEDDGIDEFQLQWHSNGCAIVLPETRGLTGENRGGNYVRCDLSGCYYAPQPPAAKSFEVVEGEGWRLGYETAPDSENSFCAIVGAGRWSIALTGREFNDFCMLIQTIRKGIVAMNTDDINERKDISLQAERGSIWMECTIPRTRLESLQLLWQPGVPSHMMPTQVKEAFEVRFILSGGASNRQAEGYWPADAVMDMLNRLDSTSFNRTVAVVNDLQSSAAVNV